MGGRGASKGGGGGASGSGSVKTVPYDKWGEMKNEILTNENGDMIGWIEDRDVFVSEPDIRPVTKKEVLDDINAYRNDDGTYGDEDTKFYLAYKDGSFVDLDDLDGKAYKKSGIVGASVSTGDYEMVWGGEVGKNGEIRKWQTWSEDGESGKTDSYSGYKTVGVYKVREKVITNNKKKDGTFYTTREKIRQSTVKPISV